MQVREMADRFRGGSGLLAIIALLSTAALPACHGCSRTSSETTTPSDDYVVQDFHCQRFDRPHRVASAVQHEGELWAVASSGALWSLSTSTPAVTRRLSSEVALGLKRTTSGLVVVSVVDGAVRARTRRAATWSSPVELGSMAAGASLAESVDGRVALVSRDELVFVSPETLTMQARIALAAPLPPASGTPVLAGPSLYLVSRAEERSSLVWVDVATGAWTVVERRDDAGLCAGPLNASCDMLGPLIPDPSHPECVLTAFTMPPARASAERVLRVCGASVAVVLAGREAPAFDALFVHRGEAWGLSKAGVFRSVEAGKPTLVESVPLATERCRFQVRQLADGAVAVGSPPVVAVPGE